MDRGAWRVMVHRVTKSQIQLKRVARTHTCMCIGESLRCASDSDKDCKSVILQYEINTFKNQTQTPPVLSPGQFHLT